jgi:SAM-dependent methyltransferase
MIGTALDLIAGAARRVLPVRARHAMTTAVRRATRWPPVGRVDMGQLRRTAPISACWGFDRGTPVDRFFIQRFLAAQAARIHGRVLEIDTNAYTRAFGGSRVTSSDVLHQSEFLPGVTLVGDLTDAATLPRGAFDCVIVTQTLQFIFEPARAVRTIHEILKPGGTALCTVPGITRIDADLVERCGHFWGFTYWSARRLFAEVFAEAELEVTTYGNVLSAAAFLFGLAAEELRPEELERTDPDYQLLVGIRATRATDR